MPTMKKDTMSVSFLLIEQKIGIQNLLLSICPTTD
jgi:hypothetical protein